MSEFNVITLEFGGLTGTSRVNNNVDTVLNNQLKNESIGVGSSIGVTFNKKLNSPFEFGMGLVYQNIENKPLYIIKAIEVKYLASESVKLKSSLGAGTYQLASPSMGYVVTAGIEYQPSNYFVSLQYQFADHLSRDQLDASDVGDGIASFTSISALLFTVGINF